MTGIEDGNRNNPWKMPDKDHLIKQSPALKKKKTLIEQSRMLTIPPGAHIDGL